MAAGLAMSDLSAQALLQLTQLVLLLEEREGLVKALWDLQEQTGWRRLEQES